MRVQIALNVENLEEAIEFYSALFDVKVNKRKPGYANFAIEAPPLKLVLFENPNADERLNHLGVEVFDDADVRAATGRLKAADRRKRERLRWANVHAFDVEVNAAAIVGFDLGFSPGEFVDFLLGWFGLDIAGDDRALPEPEGG